MIDEQFRALFAENFDDVWRFARRRVNGAAEAEDVAAEVFAVAWRRREEIPADAVRLWLFGVARFVLSNQQRESGRRSRLMLRLAGARQEHQPPPEVDGVVWQSLAALSAGDRDLLLLRAWDGLRVPEIAEPNNSATRPPCGGTPRSIIQVTRPRPRISNGTAGARGLSSTKPAASVR